MKTFFAISAAVSVLGLLTSCGAQEVSKSSKLADTSSSAVTARIEFDGVDADDVFAALTSMGVVDTDHLIGATNLRVTALRCERPLYDFHSESHCKFTFKPSDSAAPETRTDASNDASTLLELLSLHGASVNGGINASAIAVRSLVCSMPVIPNPTARCVIETL